MKFCFKNNALFFISVLLIFISIGVKAHIKNEGSQFPDIEFSDSQFEIVLLVGAGILPETPVFEPDLSLSRVDLAAWAALATGLAEGGETPDIRALSNTTLKQGLLDSLNGDATYIDINNLLFQGQLNPQTPEAVPTKGEAAQFIAMNLTTGVDGETLLDKKGMRVGPIGEVTAIESRMNPDGGSSYYITVAGETFPLYSHGRVANGPTDLIQWKNRIIKRSFLKDLGDFTLWVYLEAEPIQSVASSVSAVSATMDNSAELEAEIATNHNLLYGLTAAVLCLGFILFFKSKRS
ncbi:MAG: hypothetical protein ACKVHQ_03925 [Gammaproteobacteria bacterium]|jgi:hypothetical protein